MFYEPVVGQRFGRASSRVAPNELLPVVQLNCRKILAVNAKVDYRIAKLPSRNEIIVS